MGIAKLEIKYRDESRTRINTYKTRIKGLRKKTEELSALCGVGVLVPSFSQDLKTCTTGRRIPPSILGRYKSVSPNPPRLIPSPPLNLTFQQELTAKNKKLEEVRRRICFLEEENIMGSSSSSSQQNHEVISSLEGDRDDGCASLVAVNEEEDDEDIYSMLEDLGDDLWA